MDYIAFRRILTAFADAPTNIDINKGKLICEIRDGLIEAEIRINEGDILVRENGEEMKASSWIIRRVARLPVLADRILLTFPKPENFISPRACVLNHLDDSSIGQESDPVSATEATVDLLGQRPVGCSSVVYLTSDAGEGKTTLITEMARLQAERFKQKTSDWLLVPIPLGGKPFLRFDDLVVGYLGNRLRFPLFFFDGFMELVKMGVLVPAFDGFEEMFVQNAAGDALSAIGQLMQKLESAGTVLIAARKAYFEYQDFRTQARLFDSIGNSSVVFSRIALKRWDKAEFISYSENRCIDNAEEIYRSVNQRLGPAHPLLTRAVLVKRLLDVASETNDLAGLLQQIGNSPNDYFSVFVRAIIEREAQEKWINRSGEPHQPLLSIQDHFDLLGSIAQEMWILSTDTLKAEVLDLLTELFCEARKLNAEVSFQIRERTKQHAMIKGSNHTFSFDHEEFKNFFLGDAIGRTCARTNAQDKLSVLGLLRRGSLPSQAVDAAVSAMRSSNLAPCQNLTSFLQEIASLDGPTSFTHENVARFIIKILHGVENQPMTLTKLSFSADALRDLHLCNISFNDCAFSATSLENTVLKGCVFKSCHFDQIQLHSNMQVSDTLIEGGDILGVIPPSKDEPLYDPEYFPAVLRASGFAFPVPIQTVLPISAQPDPNLRIFNRLVRCFQFRTHINENVILKKIGPGAEVFIRDKVPQLVKAHVLGQEWIARDKQHRYYLSMSMEKVNGALRRADNSIEGFLAELSRQ